MPTSHLGPETQIDQPQTAFEVVGRMDAQEIASYIPGAEPDTRKKIAAIEQLRLIREAKKRL